MGIKVPRSLGPWVPVVGLTGYLGLTVSGSLNRRRLGYLCLLVFVYLGPRPLVSESLGPWVLVPLFTGSLGLCVPGSLGS